MELNRTKFYTYLSDGLCICLAAQQIIKVKFYGLLR